MRPESCEDTAVACRRKNAMFAFVSWCIRIKAVAEDIDVSREELVQTLLGNLIG